MTVTVRLDEETRRLLDRLTRGGKLSRSEVVRRGIHLLAEQDPTSAETNPYEAIRHLIGRVHGGRLDLSERTGERFRKAMAEKRDRRR
jgi:Arc/MetJ-type ribon-helix-helix transcriptional regulator